MSLWRSTRAQALLLIAATLLATAVLAPAPAMAQMGKGCDAFAWPLDAERTAFESPAIEKIASGAAPGAWSERAFELKLQPVGGVKFAIPPGGKPKADGGEAFGGIVSFTAPPKAGLYQVTLSGEGWIDVIQDGKSLGSTAHTGAKECPGLRKSVRFEIAAVPVVLQISGTPAAAIKISLRPAG